MNVSRARAAALTALVALPVSAWLVQRPAQAVVTSTWNVESYKDFDAGDADNAFITSLGEVKPGWATARTDVEVDGVWAAVRLNDGTALLGTDDDGAIYRVRKGKADKLATVPDVVAVVSLAAGSGGTVYAGTMPAGQIWKVNAGSGKVAKLAELPDAETVWALALAADGKTLYAGTGPKGTLFAVDTSSGKARVALETDDKRIMSLAISSDGAVWVGTSDSALVFRYDPAKKSARAMADFAGNEITALAADGAGVVVAANEFEEPSTSGVKTRAAVRKAEKKKDPGQEAKRPATGSKPGADDAPSSSADVQRKGARKGKGTLYRVRGDGRIDQLHALTQTYFTSVAITEKGRIFAGAGDNGRVYMVDTDGSVSTAFDVKERIIAALLYAPSGGLSFATSDASAFYRSTGAARKSSYTSKVWDTKASSRFGRLAWRGAGKMVVETRTGNTAEPGKGWSAWAGPRGSERDGGGGGSAKVTSPTGRYFQFRVRFDGDPGAVLRSAELYYLPQNRPTRIDEVTVSEAASKELSTTDAGVTKPRSPVLEVKWKVANPDSDKTTYQLDVRREGEVLWRPINTGKKPVTSTSYHWNTETFPDGWYRLRVTASDRAANAADRALDSYLVSALFRVDNQRPSIDGLSVRYPRASARAVDALSPIAEMSYSVDDGPWRLGTSRDGLFDDLAEMLQIQLPAGLARGVHTLSLRVADGAGNIGSASVTFRIK